jgi:hypothetical protein
MGDGSCGGSFAMWTVGAACGSDVVGSASGGVAGSCDGGARGRLDEVEEAVEHPGSKLQRVHWHPLINTMKQVCERQRWRQS